MPDLSDFWCYGPPRLAMGEDYHGSARGVLRRGLVILGVGAHTPVGESAAQTFASIRAGISRLSHWPHYVCTPKNEGGPAEDEDEFELPRVACCPGVAEDAAGPDRVEALSILAIQDLVSQGGLSRAELGRAGLIVIAPPTPIAPEGWDLDKRLPKALTEKAGLSPGKLEVLQGGPSALVRAMAAVETMLFEQGPPQLDTGLIIACDSLVDGARLEALDEGRRLKSERNPDGFIPGEGAVALAVTHPAKLDGRAPLAKIPSGGWAAEPRPITSTRWSTGEGLSEAVEAALRGEAARWLICDMNGESYGARELSLVRVRRSELLGELEHLDHPADCVGHVGASAMALGVGCALRAWGRGYAPQSSALVTACDDAGERAALRGEAI